MNVREPHKHRCMRCDNEFDCQSPDVCTAQYAVLPNVVVRGENGPEVREHCRQVWTPYPEFLAASPTDPHEVEAAAWRGLSEGKGAP